MHIFIGADHRGVVLKRSLVDFLKEQGHTIEDVGTFKEEIACDYPQIAYDVATQVARTKDAKGILLCMSGIGHSIAANKVPGAYAALVYHKEAALLSRQHNDANILVLGSKFMDEPTMKDIIQTWLSTDFEGGRHERRVQQIKNIEKEFNK